jgi:hypothetical protein
VKRNSTANNGFQIEFGKTTTLIRLALIITYILSLALPQPTYAAGGGGSTIDSGNNTGVINPGTVSTTPTGNISNPNQGTTITPLVTGSSTFNQIGNNYGSYGGYSGFNSACGIQTYISGGVSGSNNPYAITNTEGGITNSSLGSAPNNSYQLQAGITWNQQPCTDQKEILQIQTKTNFEQTKIQTQSQANTTCITQRGEITKTAISNKLPLPTKIQLDEVCWIGE